jgi:hypothetical protein
MIEVFKTNVENQVQANLLMNQIHQTYSDYKANFDLEDCDKILRVASSIDFICADCLINLLQAHGFQAEVLPDEV